MYDLCIVGAGLIGSAAARHASQIHGKKICVIGPTEPQGPRSIKDNREIYGAHYDEGRITRRLDRDPIWAKLAQRSIPRYRQLEQQSGIRFYEEIGCLMAGNNAGNFMKLVTETGKTQRVPFTSLSSGGLKSKFPFLNFDSADRAEYEFAKAGYISPRRLVAAQLKVAQQNGCDVIPEVVSKVTREVNTDNTYCMKVVTDNGKTVMAKKVLLATGAFTAFRDLFGENIQPDVELAPLTVAKVEISKAEADRIKTMPSIIYYGKGGKGWPGDFPHNQDDDLGFYMLPAILYPDGEIYFIPKNKTNHPMPGKYYIKLGHFHDAVPRRLHTVHETKEWFCSYGDKALVKSTADLICSVVNGLKMESYHGDSCVVVETPTRRPYVDTVHDQLGVALGGNGYAAKSSDEIGRLAATMLLGVEWDPDIPRDAVKLRYKHKAKM